MSMQILITPILYGTCMANGDTTPEKILDDITVVDLTTFVTGGFATTMLANQGAEVIKIEQPEVGDDSRYSGPPFVDVSSYEGLGQSAAKEGESPYFWTVNYDKKSIELDIKSEQGLAVLYDLVETADVVVENFRPGTAERLGIGYDDIQSVNEQVVYCSISAFGDSGPWSQRPGYDLLIQGMSGMMSVTGPEDGNPVKVGLPQTDLITAMWAAFGIISALFRREVTGKGERVELGMLDASLPWLTKQAGKAFVDDKPKRMGTKDPVLAPYQSYSTSDGYLNVACGNQKLWEELCEAIDCPELIDDPRFKTNADRVRHMDELEKELAPTFNERTTDEWVEILAEGKGLPVGPVYEIDEALKNKQVQSREMITEVEHPAAGTIPVIEHPLNFTNADSGFEDAPPLLGEDTKSVVHELGYTDKQIDELREAGVIPDQ